MQMMPAVKRSISFDAELLARAERVAERETGGNLSALIGQALEQRVKSSDLLAFLEEEIEAMGGISPEVHEATERAWDEIERQWAEEADEWAARRRED
jgi:hypothetical protein